MLVALDIELVRSVSEIRVSGSWVFNLRKESLLKLLLIDEDLAPRVSDLFLRQLQKGISDDSLHVPMIMEEVRALEGKRQSYTRPAEPFLREHLTGLHKKHFYQTSLIGRNLQNEWKLQSQRSTKFRDMIWRTLKKTSDPLLASQEIAQNFVRGLSERERRGDLDGEWVVFAIWEGKNYYLTLAHHKEGDVEIRKRILNFCLEQFPFVQDILGSTDRPD